MNMTDYEDARRTFRLHVPDDYEFTRDVVEHWAGAAPGQARAGRAGPARREPPRDHASASSRRASRRVANALEGLGVTAGERAFVMLPAHPRVVRAAARDVPLRRRPDARDDALHAARHRPAHRARAAPRSPSSTTRRAAKLAEVRDRCPSLRHVIVVGDAGRGRLRALRRADGARERRRADRPRPRARTIPLLLYFTSGTVAAPEDGAAHARLDGRRPRDHGALLAGPDAGRPALDVLGHRLGQGGLGQALRPVAHGRGGLPLGSARQARPRALPARARALGRDDVLRAADALPRVRAARPRRVRPRRACATPSRPASRSTPRSSAPGARPPGRRSTTATGRPRRSTSSPTSPASRCAPGSMGKPTPGNDVDVVSDDGVRLGPGEEGNIALATEPERPVGLMQGYWRDDDANAEVFHDGWYFTGDRAVQGRGRLLLVREPLRRRDHLGLVPDRPVRGRVGARRAPGGRGVGRRRQARSRPHEHRQGVRRPRARATRARTRSRASCRSTSSRSRRRTSTRARSSSSTRCRRRSRGKIRRSELRERS